jgi:carbon storage regulator
MLVLSRKTGQEVRIGADIQVKVLEIKRGRVRLGFSGPVDVPIHRDEVYQRIERNSRSRPAAAALCENSAAGETTDARRPQPALRAARAPPSRPGTATRREGHFAAQVSSEQPPVLPERSPVSNRPNGIR